MPWSQSCSGSGGRRRGLVQIRHHFGTPRVLYTPKYDPHAPTRTHTRAHTHTYTRTRTRTQTHLQALAWYIRAYVSRIGGLCAALVRTVQHGARSAAGDPPPPFFFRFFFFFAGNKPVGTQDSLICALDPAHIAIATAACQSAVDPALTPTQESSCPILWQGCKRLPAGVDAERT